MNKKIILIICAGFFFTVGFIYILELNLQLRKSITVIKNKNEAAFREQLSREKETLQKDLDERYSVDTSTFEALAKRLEIENKRTKEMEGRIKKITELAQDTKSIKK